MLCSPTPLSQRLVPGEPAPSLAAGEAILQAAWPELRVRGCGFNPLPAQKPAKFFSKRVFTVRSDVRASVTPAGSRMHCSILGFVGFPLAKIKPWSETPKDVGSEPSLWSKHRCPGALLLQFWVPSLTQGA